MFRARALAAVIVTCSTGLGAFLAPARVARAEEPKYDFADGVDACKAFRAKNDKELRDWEKSQPPIPYKYPQEDNLGGAPWGQLTSALSSTGELILASLVPHFGAQLRVDTPAATVSWPLSMPFGPGFTCSRRQGTFTIRDFRSHRVMFEPGIVSSTRGTGVWARPGYRFLYHPSDWVVGAGAGFGTTVEIAGSKESTFRPSLSPEVVVQFGHCCESGYFMLAFRYDHFFAGTAQNVIGGSLGYTFF